MMMMVVMCLIFFFFFLIRKLNWKLTICTKCNTLIACQYIMKRENNYEPYPFHVHTYFEALVHPHRPQMPMRLSKSTNISFSVTFTIFFFFCCSYRLLLAVIIFSALPLRLCFYHVIYIMHCMLLAIFMGGALVSFFFSFQITYTKL